VTSEVLSAADGLEESTEGSYVAGRHRGEGTTTATTMKAGRAFGSSAYSRGLRLRRRLADHQPGLGRVQEPSRLAQRQLRVPDGFVGEKR
jgi:hypothetical protein